MDATQTVPKVQKKKKGVLSKLVVLGVVLAVIAGVYVFLGDKLSLGYLAEQESALRQFQANHPMLVYGIAFVAYVIITGLSLPGAAFLSLVFGWYFGFVRALIMVSFASTCGATLAFLLSRYLLRDAIQSRFGNRLTTFNEALDREGAFYLFTLRLVPAIPFWAINLVMGLTRIRMTTFWWVSQLGMLAGTSVYVYAGSAIPSLAHLADPSVLRAEDIHDWPEFVEVLTDGGVSTDRGHELSSRIRERLSPEGRGLIENYEPSSDSNRSETDIAMALNEALQSPTLVNDQIIVKIIERLPPEQRSRAERRWKQHVTETNRTALVATFPTMVNSPKPLLSWQLVAAFIVLGVFPIVVKKILERVRPTRVDHPTSEGEQPDNRTNIKENDDE